MSSFHGPLMQGQSFGPFHRIHWHDREMRGYTVSWIDLCFKKDFQERNFDVARAVLAAISVLCSGKSKSSMRLLWRHENRKHFISACPMIYKHHLTIDSLVISIQLYYLAWKELNRFLWRSHRKYKSMKFKAPYRSLFCSEILCICYMK